MKIILTKGKWERWDQPLAPFLDDVVAAGFSATEIYLPAMRESPSECRRLHQRAGLALVAQIASEGPTVEDHIRIFEKRFQLALDCEPLLINTHTGRDIWSLDDNLRVFDKALELESKYGISVCHETHRRRTCFSGPSTLALLRARPQLKLTADFSHWLCVHESDLSDQPEAVAAAIQASWHIHARVGHSEGPQVADPRVPEWRGWRELCMALWRQIVEARRQGGADFLTIAPEFGPPTYMPTLPATGQPLADAWETNCWMAQYLRKELGI